MIINMNKNENFNNVKSVNNSFEKILSGSIDNQNYY